MSTERPLVSVITPAYNRADLLAETIDSLLAQQYPNLEIIVLDDGSTDDTPSVLQRYEGRIRTARHENMGQPRTVNRGFEMARGEYLCVVNSDDPQPPGLFGPLVKFLEENRDVALVYPDWEMIDAEGRYMRTVRNLDYSYVDLVVLHECIPGPGTLFRRSLVKATGDWNPAYRYCPDYEWFLRAGLVGSFRRYPEVLGQWRYHEGSVTSAMRGEAMAAEMLRVTVEFFARNDLPQEIASRRQECFRNAYITAALLLGEDRVPPDTRFAITDRTDGRHIDPNARRPESKDPAAMITWLHCEVAVRDRTIEEIEALRAKEWQQQNGTIRSLHEEVAARDARVDGLELRLATLWQETNATIQRLHEEIASRDRQLEELRKQLSAPAARF